MKAAHKFLCRDEKILIRILKIAKKTMSCADVLSEAGVVEVRGMSEV
jgi:hypothetical protein